MRVDDIDIYSVKNFDYNRYKMIKRLPRPEGNNGHTKPFYKNIVNAFDIETTALHDIEQSVMYMWQWAFNPYTVIVGRTWKDFKEHILNIKSVVNNARIVTYVHNLGYEFSFMRGIYDFKNEEVFAIDRHKILRCDMADAIEFRDSWLHSNMSLEEYTKTMNVKHRKLAGTVDYNVRRYWYSDIDPKMFRYAVYDVSGLVEAVEADMENEGDNLYTIPATSTGYVRRDVKKAMTQVSFNYRKSMRPSYNLYKCLRRAFRGGNTHANRFFVNANVFDVKSRDETSAYPFTQEVCKFPVGAFCEHKDEDLTVEYMRELMYKRGKAVLMTVTFDDLELKDPFEPVPYISWSMCRDYDYKKGVNDNGRILSYKGKITTSITDIDYKIINNMYRFKSMHINEMYSASYGNLPDSVKQTLYKYFVLKTGKKGVDNMLYVKSKNKFNSVYGMSAQDPVKQSLIYDYHDEDDFKSLKEDTRDILILLDEGNKRAAMPYQWGVWTTAYARMFLQEGIDLVKNTPDAYVIYCDTDSVKYIGDVDFDVLNKLRVFDNPYTVAMDKDGNIERLGVFTDDGYYPVFRTYGAKKYLYLDDNLVEHIAIAGVNKKLGPDEIIDSGGFFKFDLGFVFKKAGGSLLKYNESYGRYFNEDGVSIDITSNIYISDSTYTLSMTPEYEGLIKNLTFKYVDSDYLF